MRPVSNDWADAIRTSHRIAVRATLIDGSDTYALPTIIEGSVSLDANAATRGRVDLTVADDPDDETLTLDVIPDSASAALAPYGNEIKVERGLYYPDGTTEYVTLGIFRIDETETVDTADGLAVRITALDRSARIIDARFENAGQINSGVNYATSILTTIQAVYPTVAYSFASVSTTHAAARAYEAGADRWAFCQQIAADIGMELFFNGDGTLILQPIPTGIAANAVLSVSEGDDGVLLSASRRWTRQGTYNKVIATGESSDPAVPPVRGSAADMDPTSPTYFYGPFGQVPAFYVSQFLTTTAQCDAAAAAQLARQIGTTQQISFGAITNPALEPSDVVYVKRARAGIGENTVNGEAHVIDSLTIPLTASEPMSGTTRATQVTS